MTTSKSIAQIFSFVLILCGLVLYNFMSAQTWTSPSATPPAGNVTAPINIGGAYQVKSGELGALRMRAGAYCDATGTYCIEPGSWGCAAGQALNRINEDGTVNCISLSTPSSPTPVVYSWSIGSWGPWPFTFSGRCGNPRPTRTRTVTCIATPGGAVADSFCSSPVPARSQRDTSACSGD